MRRPKFRASGAGCQNALSSLPRLPPSLLYQKTETEKTNNNKHESSFELAATHRVYRMLPSVCLSLSRSLPLYLSLPHSKHTTKTCSIKFQCQPKMISALLVSSTCRKNKTHSQKCCFDPLTDEKVCEIFANRTKSLSFKVRPSLGNGNGLKLRSRRIQHGQTRTRTSRRAVSALCVLNVRYTKRRLQRHIDNRK